MGRWKSFLPHKKRFQATFCLEELWYGYTVAFRMFLAASSLSANKCEAFFSTLWLLWILHTVASFMVLAKLQKVAISPISDLWVFVIVKWYMKCFIYGTADLKSSKLWTVMIIAYLFSLLLGLFHALSSTSLT